MLRWSKVKEGFLRSQTGASRSAQSSLRKRVLCTPCGGCHGLDREAVHRTDLFLKNSLDLSVLCQGSKPFKRARDAANAEKGSAAAGGVFNRAVSRIQVRHKERTHFVLGAAV